MAVTILCVGDVVGRPGRFALSQSLPTLRAERGIDCVIANVENAAGGSGLTPALYEKMRRYGVDLMTLGDHIYRRREIIPVLEQAHDIIKPGNLPEEAPGKRIAYHETAGGHRIAIVSVLGQLFMNIRASCPFAALDRALGEIPSDVHIVVVDVHAEATSEKIALGWYLDGKVSCVFGTHTHVPTADERLLHQGTAFITDVGMSGPYDSVLGRRKDRVVGTMKTGIPSPFDVAIHEPALCGVLARICTRTGKAEHVERIRVDCEGQDDGD